jgi:hypothetical protein
MTVDEGSTVERIGERSFTIPASTTEIDGDDRHCNRESEVRHRRKILLTSEGTEIVRSFGLDSIPSSHRYKTQWQLEPNTLQRVKGQNDFVSF